jgi:capsular exopolysaccharide synthesis family protein
MNAPHTRMPPPKKPPGLEYYVPHYLNLIWRWKWYIGIVTPIVFLVWAFVAIKYGTTRPPLPCSVTLQFGQNSNSLDQASTQSLEIQKEGSDAFIRSRPFLQTIVEKLSLQLTVKKYFRSDIFDSISVGKNAPIGRYDFIVEKDGYTLGFTNERRGIKNRIITSGKLSDLSSLTFASNLLVLSRDFIAEPHSVTFSILNNQDAVQRLIWSLSTKFPGSEGRGNIMLLSCKGSDYPLVTQTVNTIADDFVIRNATTNRDKKSYTGDVLEKQLQAAQSDMANAEAAVRQFREQNPSVGATSMLGTSVNEVANLENSVSSIQRSIDEAASLQTRCMSGLNLDDQISAMFEAITFLSTRQSVAAPALQLELNDAANEKRRVDADYSPQHPLVLENRKKIARVAANVSKALSDVIDKMRAAVNDATIKKSALSQEFQKLPAKELRYAELERKRSVYTELYSTLLARYNSNRMSEASQGANVSVIDHAVVPPIPGRLQTMAQILLMGLALALILGFGPAAGLDYLDKRARNESDCRRFSTLLFLEGIPIKEACKGKTIKPDKGKLDERLVAAGFESAVFDEMYRSLRTKILLHLQSEAHKMLVVTSLNVAEGKSLTASNLSIVMAQQKLRTLLIDGDMRKGVQHHSFVLEKKPGLSEIVSSPDDLTTLPVNTFLQKTHIPNLSLLPCGMPIPNPAECMNSNKFRDLAAMLAEWFDVVILDTPPLRVAVDAAMLPDVFNHYIIVARAAKTSLDALEKKINDFPGLRQKVLGLVLNGAPVDKKMHDYSYSYYHR